MTEAEYIAEITKRWPSRYFATLEAVQLTQEAVENFPLSAKLWVMRGDLLQLIDFDYDSPLKESKCCYRQAIAADRFYAEAYEEMGYFLEVIMDNPKKAKRFFDKARRLRKSQRNSCNETKAPNPSINGTG